MNPMWEASLSWLLFKNSLILKLLYNITRNEKALMTFFPMNANAVITCGPTGETHNGKIVGCWWLLRNNENKLILACTSI